MFLNPQIKDDYCICEYGKPCGQALFSVAVPLLILSDLNKRFQIRRSVKSIIIVAYFLSMLMISFSQIYLGESSFNQVNFGKRFIFIKLKSPCRLLGRRNSDYALGLNFIFFKWINEKLILKISYYIKKHENLLFS